MQDVRETAKIQQKEQDRILKLLKSAAQMPWWKQFVEIVRERRNAFLEEIALGVHEPRIEDRLRGQVQEDAWIILLSDQAEQLVEKGDPNGSNSHTSA